MEITKAESRPQDTRVELVALHDCHLYFELIIGLLAQLPCLNLMGSNSATECLRGQSFKVGTEFWQVLILITIHVIWADPFVFVVFVVFNHTITQNAIIIHQ